MRRRRRCSRRCRSGRLARRRCADANRAQHDATVGLLGAGFVADELGHRGQVGSIGADDVQGEIERAGQKACRQHLRQLADRALEGIGRGGRTKLDVDLRLDRQAEGARVDDGVDAADHARLGQLAHPVGDGIGTQVNGGADVGEGAAAIALQDSEDLAVDLVHAESFS